MSTSSSNPSPELVINRTFRTPRELVWQAWADPKLMIKWMGPKHLPANHYENDFRPGGAWRSCLVATDGNEQLWLGGRYEEIIEPERLVFTFSWDNHPDGTKNEMLVTITLAEEGSNTRMTLNQTRFTSLEQRDDHGQGWSSSIDRLEEFLDQAVSSMPKLVARCITISLDGFSAAKGQALDAPFGKGGLRLMEWAFATKYFAQMTGREGGAEGLDNDSLVHSFDNIGATIMGRNMFGPQRGPWPNEDWKGWWGPNPPYHHPVFVLSHHQHSSFEMEEGTSFSFINDGIESALKQAFAAAKAGTFASEGALPRSASI